MYEKDVGFYGGSVALADYCPYIQEFTWRSNNVVVRGSHCMYEENNPSKCAFLHLARHAPASLQSSHDQGLSSDLIRWQIT